MLPERRANFPLAAAAAVGDGARWAAVVDWTLHTLVDASRPAGRWFAGGSQAMPVPASELGLAAGWPQRVLRDTGSLQAIFERELGADSPYGLEAGPNRPVDRGGLWLSPFVE
ncbi:MAG: hypothetical protein KGI90_06645 [Burkholderiales bacterium]|nr:hypothetical protein [Burkholderiales bacterium]